MRWCADHGKAHSELLAWSVEDRSKLMAFLMEDSAKCGMCGTAAWEWEEDPFAYEAMPIRCTGCAMKENSAEDVQTPGTRIALIPKATAQAMRDAPKQAPRRRRPT